MSERAGERRKYLTGFAFSVVLTAAAFAPVLLGAGRGLSLTIIALAAVVQVVAQLRYFLHIDLSKQKREDLQLILFSLLLLAIMAGGTLWILGNLSGRMM